MPRNKDIKKVLVIGSGPIIIGQAAEFDYAGTQACRALREEGIQTVLLNSNPATIMTDSEIADFVYIEPLDTATVKKIIEKEKPDSILPTLGGQTGLNLAMELAESGYLEKAGVKLLGTKVESIHNAEDREAFKQTLLSIDEPIIQSDIGTTIEECVTIAEEIGYPVIVRPAYTMGGTGGGIANNTDELKQISKDGIRHSRVNQVLIEKSVAGWKEIEYEVMRDSIGNVITVCNMENIDPVGIHTGDSIVLAPSQTLRDQEYHMLRTSAHNIISSLGIEGGCNVQYALSPDSMEYRVIEVNPRVSRSSALASKATGYPIARVAALIAVGHTLDELKNMVTGKTSACFEPTLDYVVSKIPKFPFDKFVKADNSLGTKMKATGEVMAIGSNIEQSLLKAVRSLEIGLDSLEVKWISELSQESLLSEMSKQTDDRFFLIADAIRRDISLNTIHDITTVDIFFLEKIQNIVNEEERLKGHDLNKITKEEWQSIKNIGISDSAIARYTDKTLNEVRKARKTKNVFPTFKVVDTCAAEFEALSPYFYSTWKYENEAIPTNNKKVVVLGSGPIRIGQGIEFDYCSVHSIWALKKLGYETIIINNNPETVSTDFDTSDRLYFEPLTEEDVLNILEIEKPDGIIAQFGGQTAIKLIKAVSDAGYKILGTQAEYVDKAEDREEFEQLLNKLNIARPEGYTVMTKEQALNVANKLGYPVLVRPSYVLGGKGMEIAWSDENISEYMDIIEMQKQSGPILVDKYLVGTELEVDAICDGDDILIPGIMEHVERSGIHSGDSISVYPPFSISQKIKVKLIHHTKQLARELKTIGLINIQYILHQNEVYVIEVNPRSSRTVPYISKVTGVPMIELATRAILGEKLENMGYGTGLYPSGKIFAVKVPIFSFEKLPAVEVSLGPEMKSTGEVLGIGYSYSEAIYKGLVGAGYKFDDKRSLLVTLADQNKQEAIPIVEKFEKHGFSIYATGKTAHVMLENFIAVNSAVKMSEGKPNIADDIASNKYSVIINTPTKGRIATTDGFAIRRLSVEHSVPCFTSLDTAKAFIDCFEAGIENIKIYTLDEILK